ncbi:DUF366 family protein [Methanobrevibacter curvatus]|uniref:DUF366 domain-containing protein n=1 Tax=Methanobrevibacter curvatus TaxID=49547 RepID=A0A166D809_9EURY|nr:DUF366 family protein [Methanobrevibacter curvatus]KZX15301.1 hypothetical protein MBCUR_02980 [Methanobrevibacter curvatus]
MEILHKNLYEEILYDGSQIESNWAFKFLGIKGSSIITWKGPMNINEENLKDFEDIGLEIKSDKMIHFIVEFFDIQTPNLNIIYLRQRLLVMIFAEKLLEYGVLSKRSGDDLYINSKKLSVSIATISLSSMKIHFAVNLTDLGTPNDVEAIGLLQLLDKNNVLIFNTDNLDFFINTVVNSYIDELKTIEMDISKTKTL